MEKYAKANYNDEGDIKDLFDHVCDAYKKDTVQTRAELNIGPVKRDAILILCESLSLKVELDYAENTIIVIYPAKDTVDVIDAAPAPEEFTSVMGEPVVAG